MLLTNSLKFPVYDTLLKDSEQVMKIYKSKKSKNHSPTVGNQMYETNKEDFRFQNSCPVLSSKRNKISNKEFLISIGLIVAIF